MERFTYRENGKWRLRIGDTEHSGPQVDRLAAMAEYIERKAAMDIVKRTSGDYATAWAELRKLPAEDVAPVAHGEIGYRNRPEHYDSYKLSGQTEDGEPLYKREHHILENNPVGYCSECGKRLCSRFTNYCPSCGAKMEA